MQKKIEQLLFIIDTVLVMSYKDIENGIKHICEYNASINQKELERLNEKYGI